MRVPWSEAWRSAASGPEGFWRREWPRDHFDTSSGSGLAAAMARLLADVDARLGSPARVDVIDVGAGDGSLIATMAEALEGTSLGERTHFTGIDLRERPAGLPNCVEWYVGDAEVVDVAGVRGLVMAHEWLDEIPLDVVERDSSGVDRIVMVDLEGRESLGDPVDEKFADWISRWWPLSAPGDRAEIGITREVAWRRLCDQLGAGTVIASDYGHLRDERRSTLRGFRDGQVVTAVPDATCNITAHVAVDACSAATPADMSVNMSSQRDSLAALGVTGQLPSPGEGTAEEYARALESAMRTRALRDPAGRGSFTWLRADR